ncbi:hypothetical protein CYMTET_8668 [Cymbomonas tetramitiformis]|uniref:Uncharacterized protein n=1 Tax=Cymbomonas tetramitiformis TaxID=36881 RepID=A0AAE0GT59_9CHLO|nr:hypothetical protein CYMTET_8668 [Cymbomonas tetramitiformis]
MVRKLCAHGLEVSGLAEDFRKVRIALLMPAFQGWRRFIGQRMQAVAHYQLSSKRARVALLAACLGVWRSERAAHVAQQHSATARLRAVVRSWGGRLQRKKRMLRVALHKLIRIRRQLAAEALAAWRAWLRAWRHRGLLLAEEGRADEAQMSLGFLHDVEIMLTQLRCDAWDRWHRHVLRARQVDAEAHVSRLRYRPASSNSPPTSPSSASFINPMRSTPSPPPYAPQPLYSVTPPSRAHPIHRLRHQGPLQSDQTQSNPDTFGARMTGPMDENSHVARTASGQSQRGQQTHQRVLRQAIEELWETQQLHEAELEAEQTWEAASPTGTLTAPSLFGSEYSPIHQRGSRTPLDSPPRHQPVSACSAGIMPEAIVARYHYRAGIAPQTPASPLLTPSSRRSAIPYPSGYGRSLSEDVTGRREMRKAAADLSQEEIEVYIPEAPEVQLENNRYKTSALPEREVLHVE